MTAWHTLGGACGHNKRYGLSLFPHHRKLCTEGLLSRHATADVIIMCTLLVYIFLPIPNYYSAGASDSSDTSDDSEEVGPLKKLLRSPIK